MDKKDVISLQVQKDDFDFMNCLSSEKSIRYTALETSSFDGQSEIVTLLITITPMILTFLGKVISEQIKAKKYVKVVYKGVQLQGIDEKNAEKIIKSIIIKDEKPQ